MLGHCFFEEANTYSNYFLSHSFCKDCFILIYCAFNFNDCSLLLGFTGYLTVLSMEFVLFISSKTIYLSYTLLLLYNTSSSYLSLLTFLFLKLIYGNTSPFLYFGLLFISVAVLNLFLKNDYLLPVLLQSQL